MTFHFYLTIILIFIPFLELCCIFLLVLSFINSVEAKKMGQVAKWTFFCFFGGVREAVILCMPLNAVNVSYFEMST